MKNPVTTLITKKTGLTIEAYCRDKLKTKYKSFYWRLRNGSLRLHEYKMIMASTGLTFEEIFIGEPNDNTATDVTPDLKVEEKEEEKKKDLEEQEDPQSTPIEEDYIDTFASFRKR